MRDAKDGWAHFLRAVVARFQLECPGADGVEIIENFMNHLYEQGRIKKNAAGKFLLPTIDDPAGLAELIRLYRLN